MVTVPFDAPPLTPTKVHTFPPSPLGVSFPDTFPFTGVFSFVELISLTASG